MPIQNAVVSIWHANSNGVNHYDEDIEDMKIDPDFAGSGRFVVNNLGYYNFITIMPGKSDGRAPHINFLIQHPDFPEFKTQMFFAENSYSNCADSALQDSELITNGLASLLIVPFTYNDQVVKTYTFNITLDGYSKFSEKK
ncbi:MAG: Protocatechuate 3 [Wolbachia endosymbiont of Ctenocephalides orientis wCori]|nr:MAG: Protocatechuate 3 [Wolbachia endosymbiont of Ctenocephalides orientis wCori]